jgi:hypothetical protein
MLDMLQIGASRAGSTWLWRMLQKHPQVTFPVWGPNAAPGGGPAYSRKSGWFWNNTSSYWKDNHWGKIKPRAILTLDEYRKWYDKTNPGKIKVDITEGAAYIPESRIKVIQQAYPDAKIVYCIRNPITTIWSHMTFSGQTNVPVNKFLKQRGGNYRKNVDYVKNLKTWKRYFPEERIKIYFFNLVRDNPAWILETLCIFLGIDEKIWKKIPKSELNTKVNSSKKNKLPEGTKTALVETYKNTIHGMEDYFVRDFSHWLEGNE